MLDNPLSDTGCGKSQDLNDVMHDCEPIVPGRLNYNQGHYNQACTQ